MSTPHLVRVFPTRTIRGGRVTVSGEQIPVDDSIPEVWVGATRARVAFASPEELGIVVTADEPGLLPVRITGVEGTVPLELGAVAASGIHQVDNPVFDRAGNLYVTYSGSRGQQVPVSIFRVGADGTRESFSSAIINPTSMAIAPDGTLYVSSRFEGAVYRVADDGSADVFASDLGIACGLAFAEDGTLFVGDRSGTIFAVDGAGRATALATLPSSVAAFHLALGPDGLFVTAPTLSARDAIFRVRFDGSVEVYHDGFGRPQGVGFGPDGSLYVVEALAGGAGLYRLPSDRAPELVLAAPRLIGFAFGPGGVLVACTSDTAYRFAAP